MTKKTSTLPQSQLRSGEVVYLIVPKHIGTSWTEETLHFRSLLVNNDGQVTSSGLKKFFNWGEQPNIHPVPTSLKGCEIEENLAESHPSIIPSVRRAVYPANPKTETTFFS